MARTRQPSCKLSAMDVEKLFPAKQHPLPECVLCHLSRSDGSRFFCGKTERLKGRYLNRPSLSEREVKLARGVQVDGNPLPAGTALKLVGGKASDRVWCRYLQGRATPKPFLVDKDALDFGNEIVEVELEAEVVAVFVHAVQIGKNVYPHRGKGGEDVVEMWIDEQWVNSDDAGEYVGQVVARLRLPLWLAREKNLTPVRR